MIDHLNGLMINSGNVSAGDDGDSTGNGVADINGGGYGSHCGNRNDASIYIAVGALLVS